MAEADLAPPHAQFRTAFDELHDVAARLAGTADFGPDDYRQGLDILLQSMDYDPHFTEVGRQMAWTSIAEALASRALAFQSMAQNPGFADVPVVRPIIITGIPRTGTTALHKLLAVDPRFQGLEKWILAAPMPRPPRHTWATNPHFLAEVAKLKARWGHEQRAAHDMVADEVDECLWLQRQSFTSNYWTYGWSAASYDAWWQPQDEAPSYRFLRQCIQLIGANDPNRRWLLKNPSHILRLDTLFATFPDALVIHTHRDPAKALPSLCALLMHGHDMMEVDRREQRARNLCARDIALWAAGVRDAERVGQAHAGQWKDVLHSDFLANPMTVIRDIYAFVGMDLMPEVEAAMRARIVEAPERANGVHRYDVRDFGLTEDAIRERFEPYVDRFGLRPERSRTIYAGEQQR